MKKLKLVLKNVLAIFSDIKRNYPSAPSARSLLISFIFKLDTSQKEVEAPKK